MFVAVKAVGARHSGTKQFTFPLYKTVPAVPLPGALTYIVCPNELITVTPISPGKVPATFQNKSKGLLLHMATVTVTGFCPSAAVGPVRVATTIPFCLT